MFTTIITLLLAAGVFIGFAFPIFGFYASNEIGSLVESLFKGGIPSGYDSIHFGEGQPAIWNGLSAMIIVTMILAGLLIITTAIAFFGKIQNKTLKTGSKATSILLFISAVITAVLASQCVKDFSVPNTVTLTIGYGMIVVLVASFFAMVFSPLGKKRK